jgi:hypothetical protein
MLTPAPARADVMLIPFYGINYGGDSGQGLSDAFEAKRHDWGVSLLAMGAGFFGFEADFGFSPDFYGRTDAGGTNIMTFVGNLVIGIPFGGQRGFGIRPYGLVGAGVMRSRADLGDVLDAAENDLTWDAGGGVLIFFTSRIGVRVDFRYFQTFDDLELFGIEIGDSRGKVDFTRTSFGFIVRF